MPAGFVASGKRTPSAAVSVNKPLPSRSGGAQATTAQDRPTSASSAMTGTSAAWLTFPLENTVKEQPAILIAPKRKRRGSLIARLTGKGKTVTEPPRFGGLSQSISQDPSAESSHSSKKTTSLINPLKKILIRFPTKDKFEEDNRLRTPTPLSTIERSNDAFPETGRAMFKSGKNVENLHKAFNLIAGTQDTAIEDDDQDTPRDAVAQ